MSSYQRPHPNYEALTNQILDFTGDHRPRSDQAAYASGNEKLPVAPKISVIMPSYNQARFLEQSILSVLNQGYPNLEFFVLDGGSDDGSVDIIKKYESEITFWRSGPDDGQAAAINEGLKLATGDWVGFQNSDDLYFPGTLNEVVEISRSCPEIDIIHGNLVFLDDDGIVFNVLHTVRGRRWLHYFLGQHLFNQTVFWKRDIMERIGYLNANIKFAFDYEYFIRLLEESPKVKYVPKYLGGFRQHSVSKTATIYDICARESKAIMIRHSPWWASLVPISFRRLIGRSFKVIGLLARGEFWYLFRGTDPRTLRNF